MSITNVPELFGSMVFNDDVMSERLPKDVYKSLKKDHRRRHSDLDITMLPMLWQMP